MIASREQYVTDGKGRRTQVILPLKAYKRMLVELEELECIRAYDAAKASGEKPVPFDAAKRRARRRRR